MNIELFPVIKVIPYARNPRRNLQAVDKVAASIKEFGFRQPIVVDNEMVIIAGHTRLLAAQKLGMDEVPVHIADNLTEAQKRAYRIADNRVSEDAEWDLDLLKIELSDLEDFDLDLLGFEDDELSDLLAEPVEGLTDEDQVPEVPENPITVLGDVWILGNHRLMCGDSTSIDAVDKLMDGQKVDLIHTDPPYGKDEKGDRSARGGLCKGNNLEDFKDDTIQYAVDAFNICQGLGIPRQVWWGANYYSHHVPQTNNWFVWDKRVEEKQKDTQSDCELAYVKSKWASVRIFRHLWKGMMKDSEHGQARVHPTQKPVALAEWVFNYYKDFSILMDLFGGSGFNLIAAEKNGKIALIMENKPYYVDVIINRWQDFTGKEAILESTNEPYNEIKHRVEAA